MSARKRVSWSMHQGTFFIYVVGALFLTLLVAYLLRSWRPLGSLEALGNAGSFLQGSLGVAVSLAGAVLAIQLAMLGTAIVEKDKRRDDLVDFNETMSNALGAFSKLSGAMNALSVVSLNLKRATQPLIDRTIESASYVAMDGKEKEELLKQAISEEHSHAISEAIRHIADALENIAQDPYARYFWSLIVERRKGMIRNAEVFRLTEFPFHRIDLDSDIWDLIEILRFRAQIVQDKGLISRDLVRQRFQTIQLILSSPVTRSAIMDEARQKAEGQDLDKDRMRTTVFCADFFVMGGLIWEEPLKNPAVPIPQGFALRLNIGGALLFDLITCLPDKEDFDLFMKSLFDDVFDVDRTTVPIVKLLDEIGSNYWHGASQKQVMELIRTGEVMFNRNWEPDMFLEDFRKAFHAIQVMPARTEIEQAIDQVAKRPNRYERPSQG